MTAVTTVLGILILLCALFLIISVLLQSSKNHRMSGVISGGAETFFGKQKGKTMDALLSKVTAVVSVLFAVLVLALYFYTAKQNNASKQNDVNLDGIDISDSLITPDNGEESENNADATVSDNTDEENTENTENNETNETNEDSENSNTDESQNNAEDAE